MNSVVFYTIRRRFKNILKKALQIDEQILSLSKKTVPIEQIKTIVQSVLPEAKFIGSGSQKTAFLVVANKTPVVLKVIKNTSRMNLYLKPYLVSGNTQHKRNTSFLKHYWSTQFCILQKQAKEVDETDISQKSQLKKLRKKLGYKLCDLRTCNFGVTKSRKVKILDASVRRNYEETN